MSDIERECVLLSFVPLKSLIKKTVKKKGKKERKKQRKGRRALTLQSSYNVAGFRGRQKKRRKEKRRKKET